MGLTLITSKTAPTDADSGVLLFVNGADDVVLDNTYDEYQFYFVNLHPSHDSSRVRWQSSVDTGSSYGVTTTTNFFATYHSEADGNETLQYMTGLDAKQSSNDDLYMTDGVGSDTDQSASGHMTLYTPSDTTYVKHFSAAVQQSSGGNTCNISRSAGYINTTSAVDAVKFSFFKSGETALVDLGTIYMYGVG